MLFRSRIDGSAPLAGIIGIRLKIFKEFDSEEQYSTETTGNDLKINNIHRLDDNKSDGHEDVNKDGIPA